MASEVLIVGAGIGGLALGRSLQAGGASVEIVERAGSLRTGGAGILLHPNALASLPVPLDEVAASGVRIPRQVSVNSDGSSSELLWAEIWKDMGLPLAIRRRRLTQILASHLEPQTIRWSVAPVALEMRDDDVRVQFEDGDSRVYKVVVGADGVNSWLRQYIDMDAKPRYLGHHYWRTVVSATGPFEFADARVWGASSLFFGGMPIGNGKVHLFLHGPFPEPFQSTHSELRRLRHLMSTMSDEVAAFADAVAPDGGVHGGSAFGITASHWCNGRLVLVGDSAHATTPIMAQGGAMALEDAAVLAEEILHRGLEPNALAAFEARRRSRVLHVTQMSRIHQRLTDVENGTGIAGQVESPANQETDYLPWYRRLYGPLADPP